MSPQTLRVLEAFLDNPAEQLTGADVQIRTRLGSGTLYPILLRLERKGWLVSRWESTARGATTPRRRLYRMTHAGVARASASFVPYGRGALNPALDPGGL